MAFESIPSIPDIFSARRVFCIQPHYDDNHIGAGGIIALLAKHDAEFFYITLTDDLACLVDGKFPIETASALLARDQQSAGKITGVKEQILLSYPDTTVYSYFHLRANLLKYICLIQPNFVLTCNPWLTYEMCLNSGYRLCWSRA